MGTKVYRYTVPIDDCWHPLRLSGPIVHVGRPPGTGPVDEYTVELGAAHTSDADVQVRELRVYGTGHPIEADTLHVGTAFGAGGALVWHLRERTA